MVSGKGIETPANKIATAQAVLGLAFRLRVLANGNSLTREIFLSDVPIHTGGQGLLLPAYPEGTDEDLISGLENILLIALSASALTVDEVLDEKYGLISKEIDMNRRGIRIMVNQLRNAFAHNPWRPKWLVFKQYRGLFPIQLSDGTRFEFDSRNLDGQMIKPEDVGGLEFWVALLQHCEKEVA